MKSEPTKPWFGPAERLAAADLWSVYREHFDEAWRCTLTVARTHPEFRRILRGLPEGELDRQQQASRAALIAGFEQNHWQPYEDFLRMQARVYAELGLEFEAWYRIAQPIGDAIAPHILARFQREPERLVAVGKALHHFLGRVVALMVSVFFEEKRRALAQRELTLHNALDSIADAVIATDLELRVTLMNPAAERIAGWRLAEASGRRIADLYELLDAQTDAPLPCPAELALRTRTVAHLSEHSTIVARGGRRTPVAGSVSVMRDVAGIVRGTVHVFRDITEQRAREAAAVEAAKALASSERQLRALAGRLQAAREEERTRISREIHDELGQRLTALKMDIGWVTRKLTEPDIQPALQRLDAMSELVDSTVKCVRHLATELRPPVLDDLGLKEAVEWLGHTCHERAGISVHIDASGWPDEEHPDVATALFRCLQELLTNVVRHARAAHVTATLRQRDGHAVLCVTDDGRGISAEQRAGQGALGLVGVRERAAALGGTFEIRARPEGGTVATVTLPVGAP